MERILEITKEGSVKLYEKVKATIRYTSFQILFASLSPGRYLLTVKKIRELRSASQNRYYWACLGMIADEVGYLSDDMEKAEKSEIVDGLHEIFKERFLPKKVIKSSKDKRLRLNIKGSTTKLDTYEFSKLYMDKIKALHPYLPDPEDKNLLTFIDLYYFK